MNLQVWIESTRCTTQWKAFQLSQLERDMNTDVATLPVRDFLDMTISLAGLQISRSPQPRYRVFFRLRLHNASETSVQLMGRKWILQDETSHTRIIEAGGVFNETPILAPGAVFSYGGCQSFQRPPSTCKCVFLAQISTKLPLSHLPSPFLDTASVPLGSKSLLL